MADSESLCTLITGASSGIGRAIAVGFSSQRRLILHGRDGDRLMETAALCADPERHIIWPYDLRHLEGLTQSLTTLMEASGIAIECFVHSAGLLRILPVRSLDSSAFTEIMSVNVTSAVQVISLLSKKRINRQQLKSILFISSIASKFGAPGFSGYSASKGALDSLMRALAVEMAPEVRVNSILPGGIATPMTDSLLGDPKVLDKFTQGYPLGLGETADIVNAAEFLVSEASRWITGQQIVVDGGRSVNISI